MKRGSINAASVNAKNLLGIPVILTDVVRILSAASRLNGVAGEST
jgi:hypothetical protein